MNGEYSLHRSHRRHRQPQHAHVLSGRCIIKGDELVGVENINHVHHLRPRLGEIPEVPWEHGHRPVRQVLVPTGHHVLGRAVALY